jgi:hypothetical protein
LKEVVPHSSPGAVCQDVDQPGTRRLDQQGGNRPHAFYVQLEIQARHTEEPADVPKNELEAEMEMYSPAGRAAIFLPTP